MNRYSAETGIEGEYEPGSRGRVLRNLRGITSVRAMPQEEHDELLRAQRRFLERIQSYTRFDAELLCEMHRDWLGGIYPWAGKYRMVEMQKGAFRWPPAFGVAANMADFESRLLRPLTPCHAGTIQEVALRVAQVHADLLLIHPFREGNGRLARWLADLMIAQAGLPTPNYDFEGKGSRRRQARYLAAVIRGYSGDVTLLAAFFVEVLTRRLDGVG